MKVSFIIKTASGERTERVTVSTPVRDAAITIAVSMLFTQIEESGLHAQFPEPFAEQGVRLYAYDNTGNRAATFKDFKATL